MYQCPRCHYETYHKGNLKNHFFKNKPCSSVYDTISQRILREKIKNKNAFKIIENNEPIINQNETNTNQNETNINQHNINVISNLNLNNNEQNKKHQCKYCNKNYSTNSHMNRHMKTCKIKIEIEQKEKEEKEKNDENIKLKNHIQKLQEENYRLKAELDKIILCKNSKPNIVNNYFTQNTQNTQNNNFKQEIKINAFREENTDYLTPEYIMGIAKRGMYYAIPKLIEKIYFNENHPENQNVKITNEKSKYGEIFDGTRFIKYAKNLIVKDMICVSIDIIDEVCCDVNMPIAYEQFSKKYNDADRILMNSLYKKAEGIALTYSKF